MFSDLPAFHSVHRHRTSPEEGRMLYENTERDFPVMDRICPSRENQYIFDLIMDIQFYLECHGVY